MKYIAIIKGNLITNGNIRGGGFWCGYSEHKDIASGYCNCKEDYFDKIIAKAKLNGDVYEVFDGDLIFDSSTIIKPFNLYYASGYIACGGRAEENSDIYAADSLVSSYNSYMQTHRELQSIFEKIEHTHTARIIVYTGIMGAMEMFFTSMLVSITYNDMDSYKRYSKKHENKPKNLTHQGIYEFAANLFMNKPCQIKEHFSTYLNISLEFPEGILKFYNMRNDVIHRFGSTKEFGCINNITDETINNLLEVSSTFITEVYEKIKQAKPTVFSD